MGNGVSTTNYGTGDGFVIESVKEVVGKVKAGQGTFSKNQALKFDSSSMNLVKATTGSAIVRYALEAGDATSEDVSVLMLAEGTVNGFGIVGIDYIVSTDEMDTPDAPIAELVAGGTLTAATHTYKTVSTNKNGATAPGATTSVITHVATSGYAESENAYANIAAMNAALGNCSVTNKIVRLNVDGTLYSVTFNADYTGEGALANWAAFIAKLDTAGSTTTASDGNKFKVRSDTTGATSKVLVVADETGIFGTATEVSGTAIEKTVKVTFDAVANSTGCKVWRTIDGGTTWKYYVATATDIANGYITDDGTLTWTTGTPVTATDFAALQLAENHGLYVTEVISGYEFRQVD